MENIEETNYNLSFYEEIVGNVIADLTFSLEPNFSSEMEQLRILTKTNTKKAKIRESKYKGKNRKNSFINIYKKAKRFSSGEEKSMLKVKNG